MVPASALASEASGGWTERSPSSRDPALETSVLALPTLRHVELASAAWLGKLYGEARQKIFRLRCGRGKTIRCTP
jgi:hypothetical protein